MIAYVLAPLILIGFYSLGRTLLSLFAINPEKSVGLGLEVIVATAIGIIIAGYYWFLMGLCDAIHLGALVVFFGFLLIVTVLTARHEKRIGRDSWVALHLSYKKNRHAVFFAVLFTVILTVTFARCFATYIRGDSLVYHLYLAKRYVLSGSISGIPFSEHAYWPFLTELLFIPGEMLGSLFLSKFISFIIYILFVALCGLYVYKESGQLTGGLVTAAILASTPVIFSHAPATYNDISFSFFLILSFVAWRLGSKADSPHLWPYFFSGVFCGASLSCKYLGLYGAIALAVLIILDMVMKRRLLLKHHLLFFAGLVVIGAPFYIRSLLHYGNPVFPFAASFFNTPFGYGATEAGFLSSNLSDFISGEGRGLLNFIALPFFLTSNPESFGGDKVGLIYLILSPAVLFVLKKRWQLFSFIFVYTLIWFSLSQYTRYLIPALALGAMLIGFGMNVLSQKRPKLLNLLMPFLIGALLFQTAWSGYHTYKDFMIREEEPIIEIADWMNTIIKGPGNRTMVIGDERLYYYNFEAFRERTFRNFTSYPDFRDSVDVLKKLDGENVEYLVIADSLSRVSSGRKFDPRAYFRDIVATGAYTKLGGKTSSEGITYRVYRRNQPK